MKNYVVKPGQSLYDVCIQIFGTLDYLMTLITQNNLSSVHAYLNPGQIIIFDPSNQNQASLFNSNLNTNTIYATNIPVGSPMYAGGESFEYDSYDNSFEGGGN